MKLNLLLLLLLLCNFSYGQGYSGLVARWPFNGNTKDVSGHGLDGIPHGISITKGYTGITNTAYHFDGKGYIYVPYDSSMNINQLSICVLIKPLGYYSGTCQANTILSRGYQYQQGNYYLQYHDNGYDNDCYTYSPGHDNFSMGIGAPLYSYPDSSTLYSPFIDTNQWYCVVTTYDGDTMKVYVDGALKKETYYPVTNSATTDGLSIGIYMGDTINYPYNLTADIDEIRLYNRALYSADVQTFCDSAKMYIDDQNTAVNSVSLGEQIKVFPNPATGNVYINVPASLYGSRLNITNTLGQSMYNKTLTESSNTIDLSGYPDGLYFISVNNKNLIYNTKIVKAN